MTKSTDLSSLEAANRLIRTRRTVKPAHMRPDPLPREVLENLFENANWAPTHGLTEPWRFTVFEGAAREELARFLSGLYRTLTPEKSFRPDKCEKLSLNPGRAGAVVAIGMKRQEIEKIPEIEEIEAVACAVQNMHLTASALGLAAFWSSPPLLSSEEMKTFLGLGPKDACLGLFYLGWPEEGFEWPTSPRGPVTEKIEWRA